MGMDEQYNVIEEDNPNYIEMSKLGCVLEDAFKSTSDRKVLNYREAMKVGEDEKWAVAIKTEYNKFTKFKVWEAVEKTEVPMGAKVLTSTWILN